MPRVVEAEAPLLTADEARKFLRMGRNAFYEAVARGEVPSFKIGRRLFIPRAGIENLIADALTRKAPTA